MSSDCYCTRAESISCVIKIWFDITWPIYYAHMYTLDFPVNTKESEFENIPFLKFSPNLFQQYL